MGRDSIYLAMQGADVWLLDYLDEPLRMGAQLAKEAGVSVHTIRCDAYQLAFKDETFDIVYSQGLLEHFKDPKPLLLEQKRVCKKGGFVIADVPQKYHLYTVMKHILQKLNQWTPGWETEYSICELRKIFTQAGLKEWAHYGDWSHPMLPLKMIMIALKMRRRPPRLREDGLLLRKIKNSSLAFCTFQHIGLIGEKT